MSRWLLRLVAELVLLPLLLEAAAVVVRAVAELSLLLLLLEAAVVVTPEAEQLLLGAAVSVALPGAELSPLLLETAVVVQSGPSPF